jgi:hypothetical protein
MQAVTCLDEVLQTLTCDNSPGPCEGRSTGDIERDVDIVDQS